MAKAKAEPAQQETRDRGRPTKFAPKILKQARQLALLGLTDAEMAKVFDVALSTFALWKRTHKNFSDAIAQGKTIADAEVAASLHHRAIGYSHPEVVISAYQGVVIKTRVTKHYPPDTQAASIWLRNRAPTRWRSQPEPIDPNEVPTPVKVVVEVKDGRRVKSDAKPDQAAG